MPFSVFCYSLFFKVYFVLYIVSFMTQTVKNLPEMQEAWVQSLGWEEPCFFIVAVSMCIENLFYPLFSICVSL